MQAEKRRQKLVRGKALKEKTGGPKLLARLPLDEEPDKELAPVARNSIYWGTFMATSANARYQLLNGLEERYLVGRTPQALLLERKVQNPLQASWVSSSLSITFGVSNTLFHAL